MTSTASATGADLGVNLSRANHVGIAVSDLDRTIAFYHALTGKKPFVQERMCHVEKMYGPKIEDQLSGSSERTEMRYATLQLDNINIDIIEFEKPDMGTAKALPNDRGAMHLCLEVDDIQAVYDRLTAAGIEFDAPPFEFLEENAASAEGTKVAYFSDPDGVNLELIQPAPGSFKRE